MKDKISKSKSKFKIALNKEEIDMDTFGNYMVNWKKLREEKKSKKHKIQKMQE